MGDRRGSHGNNWQLKRVNSVTGPVGTFLSDAIRNPNSVSGQTEVLWTSGSDAGNLEQKVGHDYWMIDNIYGPLPPLSKQYFLSSMNDSKLSF